MFLNPFILSGEFAGPEKGFFDFGAVFTATILATALACFIMAFYGKTWPIGLAPGMGINAFVAFGVVAGYGLHSTSCFRCSLSSWYIIFNYFSYTHKSMVNKLNSKKFKIRNWSRYRTVFSHNRIGNYGSCWRSSGYFSNSR